MNAIMHRMDWGDLRFFHAIACAGSIRGSVSVVSILKKVASLHSPTIS